MQTIDLADNIFSLPVCEDNQKQLTSPQHCGVVVPATRRGISSATTSPVEAKEIRRSSAAITYVPVIPHFASVVICSPAYLVGDEIHVSWKRETGKNIFPCSP